MIFRGGTFTERVRATALDYYCNEKVSTLSYLGPDQTETRERLGYRVSKERLRLPNVQS
jgi:hypothetical protein